MIVGLEWKSSMPNWLNFSARIKQKCRNSSKFHFSVLKYWSLFRIDEKSDHDREFEDFGKMAVENDCLMDGLWWVDCILFLIKLFSGDGMQPRTLDKYSWWKTSYFAYVADPDALPESIISKTPNTFLGYCLSARQQSIAPSVVNKTEWVYGR